MTSSPSPIPLLASGGRRASLFALIPVVLVSLLWGATLRGQTPDPVFDFTAPRRVSGAPAIGGDGTVYFGAIDGRLYALRPDGTKRWDLVLGGGIQASPVLGRDEVLYVGDLDGGFHAVNATGTLRWSFKIGSEIQGAAALGVDGTIYFGSLDRRLYALNPDGTRRWDFLTGGGVFSTPAIASDGTIVFGSRDNRVYALRPDGSLKWSFQAGNQVEASPAIGPDGVVFIGSHDRRLYALNPDGTRRWDYLTSDAILSPAAVAPSGRVHVANSAGVVHALNPDGTLIWQTALPGRVGYCATAVAADGSSYVATQDGDLIAIAADGGVKWTFAFLSRIQHASPVIAPSGTLYLAAESGRVVGLPLGTGPATSAWPMFGRDPRHTGGGFVDRLLPAAYSAGASFEVALVATVPPGIGFYSVEDTLPANWQISRIGHEGVFEAAGRRVKFGPFLDGQSRRLTYTVTPPLGEGGPRTFAGSSTIDGTDRWLGGTHRVDSIPLHPADSEPVDRWLTVAELTRYAAAWKRGSTWPIAPGAIPAAYLDRAITLWESGEYYRFDTNYVTAPQWWVPVGPANFPQPTVSGGSPTNGSVVADMPVSSPPGSTIVVKLRIAPAPGVVAYAIEDLSPPGWTVSELSDDGFVDPALGKVKWGPFFDSLPRTLTYRVTIPAGAAGLFEFEGVAAFDGSQASIAGLRRIHVATETGDDLFAERELPSTYSPGSQFVVRLNAVPPVEAGWYFVEEAPPSGWEVGAINAGGFYDPVRRTVNFGPFLDREPRELEYEITPPTGETGLRQFLGSVTTDIAETPIGGDTTLEAVPLHPADLPATDAWLTLAEVTAYGAAWKSGASWPFAPASIPLEYVTRASALWRGGEAYTWETGATNPPSGWINLTNPPSPAVVPPSIPPGAATSLGRISATQPRFYQPGAPLSILLVATPAAEVRVYAVEDQPPTGWTVGSVSHGGTLDPLRGKVKWGPFFDPLPRELSYQLVAPETAMDVTGLTGGAAFDGEVAEATGPRAIYPAGTDLRPSLSNLRWDGGTGSAMTLRGLTNEIYVIEASVNLIDWEPLTTLTNTLGTLEYQDATAVEIPARAYRVLWP